MHSVIMAVLVLVLIFMAGCGAPSQYIESADMPATSSPNVTTDSTEQFQVSEEVRQRLQITHTDESNAVTEFFVRGEDGTWSKLFEDNSYVGQNGMGKKKEGDMKTPIGEFGVRCAFGIEENPGTSLNYIHVTPNTYACGDDCEYYNQIIDTERTGHDCHGEEMFLMSPEYNYGLSIDYNPQNEVGKGSAIFIHCKGQKTYTGGCVALDEEHMKLVLQCAEPGMRVIIK